MINFRIGLFVCLNGKEVKYGEIKMEIKKKDIN